MKTGWIAGPLLMWALVSCGGNSKDQANEAPSPAEEKVTTMLDLAGKYEGMLPCSGCTGIKAELLLGADSTFSFRRVFLGTSQGDSIVQRFGKLSAFNYLSKLQLNDRQNNEELWIAPAGVNRVKFIQPDGADIPGYSDSLLVRTSKIAAVYPEYKVSYKLVVGNPDKSFVFSQNPRGDIAIDKVWLDMAGEGERSMIAWYAWLFNTGCREQTCELTTALGVKTDEEILAMISKKLNIDSLKVITGLQQDKSKMLNNLYYTRNMNDVHFNYTVKDASGQAFSGNDSYGIGNDGTLHLKRHKEIKIEQFTRENRPPVRPKGENTSAPNSSPKPLNPKKRPATR